MREEVFQVQLDAVFCQPKKSSLVVHCKESEATKIFPRMTRVKIIARNQRATSRYKFFTDTLFTIYQSQTASMVGAE